MTSAQEAIQRNMDEYIAACNTGDVDDYVGTMTPDVVFSPPGEARVAGHAAIRTWVQAGFFDPFNVTFHGEFDRIVVVGSEAFAPGRFTLHLKPKDGSPAIDANGSFFDVFREEAGEWKLASAIFNFTHPMG